MPKLVKYLLVGSAALIGVLLIAVGIIAATFNPNDYKPQLIKVVHEKTQRTLSIPGEIKLSFFPKLGVDLGKLSISEHNSTAEFAAIDSAKVSLALLPLLSKQLVVDRVKIDGLRANIRRFKDGATNFDDLLSKETPQAEPGKPGAQGQQIKFDIDSIDVTNALVVVEDQKDARTLELGRLNLETGKVASGVPSELNLTADIKANKPAINARLAFKSGFMMNFERGQYIFKALDGQLSGAALDFTELVLKLNGDADLTPAAKQVALNNIKFSAAGKRAGQPLEATLDLPKLAMTDTKISGGQLNGAASVTQSGSAITARFSAPSFEGTPQAFTLPALKVDATLKDAKRDVNAALSGALSVNFGTRTIDLTNLLANLTIPNPGGSALRLKTGGSAHANLAKETVSAILKGSIDESAFDAKLGLTKFSPAAYAFDIGIDRIDLDRYTAQPAAKPGAKPAAAPPGSAAPEKPIDLSALRDLRADGSVRVGSLKIRNIRTSNVHVGMHAAGGKLDINPLTADLYGGSVAGTLSATASTPPHIAVRQNLTGINVAPLLKDMLDKEPIAGRGNVRLDVTTSGGTFAQMRRGLNGTARLELRDGAVRGVNLAQSVRSAKAKLGALTGNAAGAQAGVGSSDEKTDFSELTGSFRIANGVAHNDDLNLKSPLLRIGGAGDIDLGAEHLDYLARATVVESLQGQGGPELQALKGVTVPVRLSGPFTSIAWHIDFADMASEVAKQQLGGKKEELQSKAQKALEEQKAKAQGQLQEQLKGLFGR